MEGRPLMPVPVFMKVWAGSWLICSVTIDRTMAISSTIFAVHGMKSLTYWPPWPCWLELCQVPLNLKCLALKLGNGLPLGEGLGHGLSRSFRPASACSRRSRGGRVLPAMQRKMTRFGLCLGQADSRGFLVLGCLLSASNRLSAADPRLKPEPARKARRLIGVGVTSASKVGFG